MQVPKYFGLEDSDLPAIAIHESSNDGKYFFKNAAVKKVEKWLDDFEVRRANFLHACFAPAFVVLLKHACTYIWHCGSGHF